MEDLTGLDGEAFLQDFLEESEEHLHNISSHLLALERQAAQGEVDAHALNEVLRALHTIKGLSGMVGLQAAAELSHELESVLRQIRADRLTLTPSIVDALMQGTRVLEGIIHTVRDPEAPMPDIEPVLALLPRAGEEKRAKPPRSASPAAPPKPRPEVPEWLRRALPPSVQQALQPADVQRIEKAVARGQYVQLAVFTPSAEKVAAGITVNAVREQLEQHAQIVKAIPLIDSRENGDAVVRFAFLVIADRPPSQVVSLPGLSWSEVRPAPPAQELERRDSRPVLGREPSLVRVDVARLDHLMELVGELSRVHHRLELAWQEALEARNGRRAAVDDVLTEMERQLRYLREAVIRVRLVPLAEVFGRMPLAVRDLSRAEGKQVRLILEGEEAEVDKALADRLLDPLMHLVRNAIAHGIEPPEERAALRKPTEATLHISAHPEGEQIVIAVADDGRGVDMDRVAEKARSLGWLAPDEPLTDALALEFLCRPGFSTRDDADMSAGRGVGLDVVWQMVSQVGGQLEMQTAPGRGTTFTMRLPVTLLIMPVILVGVGAERYAVPRTMVEELIAIAAEEVVSLEDQELLSLRGRPVPMLRLADLFHVSTERSDCPAYGLVVDVGQGPAVLGVDRLLGLREVVVRHFHDPLISAPGVAGATEIGDGRPILIIDVPDLLRFARERQRRSSAS